MRYAKTLVSLVALYTLLLGSMWTVNAQGVDQQPGDRVIVFCEATYIDVYGSDNNGTGIFLARIRYFDLLQPGPVTVQTQLGRVVADINERAMVDVQWFEGPFYANGSGDFAKWVTCPVDFSFPVNTGGAPVVTIPAPLPTVQIGVPAHGYFVNPVPSGYLVGYDAAPNAINQTAIVQNSPGATVYQRVENNQTDRYCGTNAYVVRPHDTLFKISQWFGTTVGSLAICNNISDPRRIYAGQSLIVP